MKGCRLWLDTTEKDSGFTDSGFNDKVTNINFTTVCHLFYVLPFSFLPITTIR